MRQYAPVLLALAFSTSGCSGPIAAYHDIEGGAIAQNRQPPPGADLPYPNLAAVPAAPEALTPAESAQVNQRLNPAVTETPSTVANPAALAGLALPGSVPPPTDVGLNIPSVPSPAPGPSATLAATATAAVKPPDGPPVALRFRPGSAIVTAETSEALTRLAQSRGEAKILACGFGEQQTNPDDTALTLALNRATAIADALTAAGVPPDAITLNAAATGSGGFAQLVY